MADWYKIEESARQKQAKDKIRSIPNRPTKITAIKASLARDLEEQDFGIPEIKSLISKSYTHPVISLYLSLDPDKLIRDRKVYLSYFNSLKHKALQDFNLKTSPAHSEEHTIDQDFTQIESFLTDYENLQQSRSIVIFKSGDHLNKVIKLSVPSPDHLVINSTPQVAPLIKILEEHKNVLAIQVSQKNTKFSLYRLGELIQLDNIKSTTSLDDHLKIIKDKAEVICKSTNCTQIVIVGEDRITNLLIKLLQTSNKNLPISALHISPHESISEITTQIDTLLQSQETENENQAIQTLNQLKNQGLLITGINQIISAQNRYLLRSLYVDPGFQQKGFMCGKDHYLSLEKTSCPLCHSPLEYATNLVDELVEIARLQQMDVHIITYNQEQMHQYDHIAGSTY